MTEQTAFTKMLKDTREEQLAKEKRQKAELQSVLTAKDLAAIKKEKKISAIGK